VNVIASIFGGFGLKILAGLAIVGAILAVLTGARQAGRNAERVDGLQRNLENARVRREIDRDVRAATDDDLNDGLRHPSRRRR
jgi:hypothetical protein